MVTCCALAAVLLQKRGEEALPAALAPEVQLGPGGSEVLVGAPVASVVPSTCGWDLFRKQTEHPLGKKAF